MDRYDPLNAAAPGEAYRNANEGTGDDGSFPNALGFDATMTEIVNAIAALGGVPSNASWDQLGSLLAGALALKAARESPALTGTPTAPTAALGTNTDQIATMAAIKQAIDALVAAAPAALDTLVELSAALGNDADFAATMTTALAGKLNNAGDTVTGLIDVFTTGAGLRLTSSDNTAALVTALALRRGSGAGNSLSVQTRGDEANGLDQLRLAFAGGQAYTFNKAGNFLLGSDPVANLDAATKQYVDAAVRRRSVKGPFAMTQGLTAEAAHGLVWTPASATVNLICAAVEGGFSVGQKVAYGQQFWATSNEGGVQAWWDDTNYGYLVGWGISVLFDRSGSGQFFSLTPAKWNFEIILEE